MILSIAQGISNFYSKLNITMNVIRKTARLKPLTSYNSNKSKTNNKRKFSTYTEEWTKSTLKPNYRAPVNPIVLCHGPDILPYFQIHYWQGIVEALTKIGAKVIITKVPWTGSIEERATELHKQLSKNFSGKNLNLIGHSMGGLDCRHLISRIKDKNYQISSLTTLSTPHRGSSFMDWCRDHLKLGYIAPPSFNNSILTKEERQDLFKKLMYYFDTPAYYNLTTEYCKKHFNPQTPDDPLVKYFSFGAYSDELSRLNPLYIPHKIVTKAEGLNDGLVSLKSSSWGEQIGLIECNHFELVYKKRILETVYHPIKKYLTKIELDVINLNTLQLNKILNNAIDDSAPFNTIEFYLKVAEFLHSRGF